MSHHGVCQKCGMLFPEGYICARIGLFWVCQSCAAAAAQGDCSDFAHTYRGAVNEVGANVLCCLDCGKQLWSTPIVTDKVEAAPPAPVATY